MRNQLSNRIFNTVLFVTFILSPHPYVYGSDFYGSLKGITITDAGGTNSAPTAVIKYTQNGNTVSFDARGSSDSDGRITEYRWDFGDGTTDVGSAVNHTYLTSGSIQVTLTAIDDGGGITLSQINIVNTPTTWINASGSYTPWALLFVDSEETAREKGQAVRAFDGNPDTSWVTDWSTTNPPPPHEIQIDLGGFYAIDGFSYLPRQDGKSYGTIAQYEIFISSDVSSWGEAVATGTFSNDTTKKIVSFPESTGRYLRLRALSEVDGQPWTVAAEVDIRGKVVTVPSAWINASGHHPPWSLLFVDSQETAKENGRATRAFDGNPDTRWSTDWSSINPPPPHEIQIDLGASYIIDGLSYLPRQDGKPHGTIAQYEIFISSDGTNWGGTVSTGTFSSDATKKIVSFPETTGRYVRLRALSEINGQPWTVAAEIDIRGK